VREKKLDWSTTLDGTSRRRLKGGGEKGSLPVAYRVYLPLVWAIERGASALERLRRRTGAIASPRVRGSRTRAPPRLALYRPHLNQVPAVTAAPRKRLVIDAQQAADDSDLCSTVITSTPLAPSHVAAAPRT
jgi:hypothetical protein